MVTIGESKTVPGREAAFSAFERATDDAIAGRDTYPDGSIFVGTDLPGWEKTLLRALKERRPVVLVDPDGQERIVTPTRHRPPLLASLPFLRRMLRR